MQVYCCTPVANELLCTRCKCILVHQMQVYCCAYISVDIGKMFKSGRRHAHCNMDHALPWCAIQEPLFYLSAVLLRRNRIAKKGLECKSLQRRDSTTWQKKRWRGQIHLEGLVTANWALWRWRWKEISIKLLLTSDSTPHRSRLDVFLRFFLYRFKISWVNRTSFYATHHSCRTTSGLCTWRVFIGLTFTKVSH